jgi:hypothetical protein
MKEITLFEKYPVFTVEILKESTRYITIDEIFAYLKNQIDVHPIAIYIGEFDHYTHTSSLEEGEISSEIKNAKNILCCFGKVLPKPEVLAVRPRSIGVAEMENSFVVSFLEAPNPDANASMIKWVEGIATH